MLENILKEIESVFDENIENIEDENGVHHFVIDSFAAKILARDIIHKYINAGKDINVRSINDGWIPCDVRLPDNDCSVLMCDKNGCIDVGWWTGKRWVTGFSHADIARDIIAWRPLPEPYCPEKGE